MITVVFRWFRHNLGVLLLSLGLAIVVWVSAVISADPNEERTFHNVPIELLGREADFLLEGIPTQATVTLFAPRSLLNRYANQTDLLHISLNVANLTSGSHTLPLNVTFDLQPTRLVQVQPAQVTFRLERQITRTMPILLQISGKPARGYVAGQSTVNNSAVTVTGPESMVNRVATIVATLDITNADQNLSREVALQALDAEKQPISGIQLKPARITINQPIRLQGGYRNLVVKIITTGQIAAGYRLTNITITPPNVIVFSDDPQIVDNLPGYIETMPLDLTDLTETLQTRLQLNLPEGVTLTGDQTVRVEIGIAAIESSMTMNLPITFVNLDASLQVQAALQTLDVIVTGPVKVLENLNPEIDLRAILDLGDLAPGTYTLTPKIEILPQGLRLESFLPENVEVTLTPKPTATPEITPTP